MTESVYTYAEVANRLRQAHKDGSLDLGPACELACDILDGIGARTKAGWLEEIIEIDENAAQSMAKARWAKTTPSERSAYARKMLKARWSPAPLAKKAKKGKRDAD